MKHLFVLVLVTASLGSATSQGLNAEFNALLTSLDENNFNAAAEFVEFERAALERESWIQWMTKSNESFETKSTMINVSEVVLADGEIYPIVHFQTNLSWEVVSVSDQQIDGLKETYREFSPSLIINLEENRIYLSLQRKAVALRNGNKWKFILSSIKSLDGYDLPEEVKTLL